MFRYVRTLRDVVGRWWRSRNGGEDREPLSEGETLWNAMIDAGGCLVCNAQPKGFVEGPSGGISTNVFCSHCGQGYNITPLVHTAELIHVDKRYTIKTEEERDALGTSR